MSDTLNIDRIAELARIKLMPDERERLKQDLEKILHYVEKLRELDTEHVEPTSHVLNLENVFREDLPRKSDVIKAVLAHAPSKVESYFKVPKIVEG